MSNDNKSEIIPTSMPGQKKMFYCTRILNCILGDFLCLFFASIVVSSVVFGDIFQHMRESWMRMMSFYILYVLISVILDKYEYRKMRRARQIFARYFIAIFLAILIYKLFISVFDIQTMQNNHMGYALVFMLIFQLLFIVTYLLDRYRKTFMFRIRRLSL